MSLMTKAEYARHRGMSRANITQLVGRGRIKLDDEGLIDQIFNDYTLDGRRQTKQTKFLNSKIHQGKNKTVKKGVKLSAQAKQQNIEINENVFRGQVGSGGNGKEPLTYDAARTALIAFNAQIRKLEYECKKGNLLQADKVQKECFEMGRDIRDAILNVPDRISPILAAESDQKQVNFLLKKELEEALEGIQKLESYRGKQ